LLGISTAHVIRIVARGKGSSAVDIQYKEDCRVAGWFPSPVSRCAHTSWNTVFRHEDVLQGFSFFYLLLLFININILSKETLYRQ
jgi:hypothetical protein